MKFSNRVGRADIFPLPVFDLHISTYYSQYSCGAMSQSERNKNTSILYPGLFFTMCNRYSWCLFSDLHGKKAKSDIMTGFQTLKWEYHQAQKKKV